MRSGWLPGKAIEQIDTSARRLGQIQNIGLNGTRRLRSAAEADRASARREGEWSGRPALDRVAQLEPAALDAPKRCCCATFLAKWRRTARSARAPRLVGIQPQ